MQGSTDPNGANEAIPELFVVLDEPAPPETPKVEAALPPPVSSDDQRRTKRQRVLKLAKLVFGVSDSTIDCLIIDETRFGVMLETHLTSDIPEQVKICFIGGRTFDAIRRWATGNKIGLEFVGRLPEDEATKAQLRAIRNVLRDVGVHAAVQMLREVDFYESSEIRSTAETAEIAIARLEAALT